MNPMKKFIAFIFAALFAAGAWAHQYETTVDGTTWYYNLISDGKGGCNVEITYRGNTVFYATLYATRYSGSLTIPSTLGGYKVTTIGDWAFYGCSSLTSVTIPSSVTTIGECAFDGCSSLTSVTIPDSVTTIGSHAFDGCSSLTSVTIPDSVTTIGSSAFSRCSKLTSVTIPNSVTTIGDWAFCNCRSLQNVDVASDNANYCSVDGVLYTKDRKRIILCPGAKNSVLILGDVTTIGDQAFSGCGFLISVTIPDGVTEIGSDAFSGCNSLTSVTIPESVTEIGSRAFNGCSSLASITIPNSVTTIGVDAFYRCSSLASVTIPGGFEVKSVFPDVYSTISSAFIADGSTTICNYAFRDCSSLTSITIPDSVTAIGWNAFYDCSSLKEVHIADLAKWCSISFGNEYANPCYYAHYLYLNGEAIKDLVIPEGVTTIGDWAFYGCSSLASVTIPDGVTTIGRYAFSGCSSLTSMTIPESVKTIGKDAFVGCDNLTNVIIEPNSALKSDYSWGVAENKVVWQQDVKILVSNRELPLVYDGLKHSGGYKFECDCNDFDLSNIEYVGAPLPELQDVGTVKISVENEDFEYVGDDIRFRNVVVECSDQELSVTILPRSVTVSSASASKSYDGTPLKASYTLSGDGFAAGEECSISTLGEQTEIGSSTNTISVVWDKNAKESNYTLTRNEGTLTVLPWPKNAGPEVAATFSDAVSSQTEFSVPDGVEVIANEIFERMTSLREVKLPDSLREIDYHAFDHCSDINREFRGGYMFMDGWLFGYDASAAEEIPDVDSIRGIADGALEGCMSLKCFNCSDKALLKRIPQNAFADCGALKVVELHEGLKEIGEEAFIGCSEVANFVIPGSVKSIGDRAFAYCSSLTNAQIAYGVESIGDEAFLDCWRISEVDIPSTVKSVGANAFGGDSSIIRAGMRGDIRKISEVFSNYSNIREFIIKEGEGALKDRLFAGCSELKDVRILGDCPEMENDGQYLYANAGKISEPITTYVTQGSYGWNGRKNSTALPQAWPLTGSYRHSIAIWDNPTYLCEFDSNGGTLGVQKTYQTSEKNFILPPEPTQSGYVFGGWWTSPVGGIHITEKNIFIEGVYQRLYAHWVKARTVILDANGGTITTNAMMYVEQTTYGVLPAPVRTGYAFGGWTYNGQTIVPDTSIKTDADHQLLAQWNAIKYTVKFNANYGTGSAADMLCAYDKPYSTPTEGFSNGSEKLSGWALSPQGEVVYKRGETFKNLASQEGKIVILYAIYRKGGSAELQDLYDEYGPFVPGKEIEPINFAFAAGWKISGLPAGIKYDAKSGLIIGKPTKSGEFKVTLTRTSDKAIAITTFEVMSAEEDKQAITLAVGGLSPADAAVDEFAALELPVGVTVDWSIEAEALSSTTVKVAGLPAGLKLVQNKVTKAYSIQGVPTAASKIDAKTGNVVPSLAKFTITTAGKNSRVFTMPIAVKAMPAWAVGTFNGGYLDDTDHPIGISTLTISATGKISGKVLVDGLTWTLTAASFGTVDEEGAYHATLTAKAGKETQEITITVDEEGVVGSGIIAYQNLWKAPDLAALGKELAVVTKNGYVAEDEIALKIAATGAVTATKTFDLGTDAKGKAVIYKASCSTTLIPMEGEDYTHIVFVYFAPNLKTGFEGYSTCLFLELVEEAYIDLAIGEALPNEETSAFEPVTLLLGETVNWELTAEALTATTIAAAGLPSGLKLVLDKQTKEYSIQGVPNKFSKFDRQGNAIPSLVKFTVTSAGKNKRVFTMKIVVVP